jgi:hypothetical protein
MEKSNSAMQVCADPQTFRHNSICLPSSATARAPLLWHSRQGHCRQYAAMLNALYALPLVTLVLLALFAPVSADTCVCSCDLLGYYLFSSTQSCTCTSAYSTCYNFCDNKPGYGYNSATCNGAPVAVVTTTTASPSTSSPSTSSPSSSSSTPSLGLIIGLGFGLPFVVLTCTGCWCAYCCGAAYERRRKAALEAANVARTTTSDTTAVITTRVDGAVATPALVPGTYPHWVPPAPYAPAAHPGHPAGYPAGYYYPPAYSAYTQPAQAHSVEKHCDEQLPAYSETSHADIVVSDIGGSAGTIPPLPA